MKRRFFPVPVLTARADGHKIETLEGLQGEAEEFIGFIADQGADQCGFCNPGFVMNTIALLRENPDPTDDEIRAYLAGNLRGCRIRRTASWDPGLSRQQKRQGRTLMEHRKYNAINQSVQKRIPGSFFLENRFTSMILQEMLLW